MSPIRVAIVDDHPLVRGGLCALLDEAEEFEPIDFVTISGRVASILVPVGRLLLARKRESNARFTVGYRAR